MTTETDTLSLPTSTAPTDITESTCLPMAVPCLPTLCEEGTSEWDTNLVPNLAYHRSRPSGGGESVGGSSAGGGSSGSEYMYSIRDDDFKGPGRYGYDAIPFACISWMNHERGISKM